MTSIFSAIVPVMLIILVGYLAGYTFLNVQDTSLSKSRQERASIQIQTISQLTLYILYPALIFDSFYQTNISIESATGLLIGFFVTSCLIYGSILLVAKVINLSLSTQKAFIATVLFPNNGNMGLPIITFALGNIGLKIAILYMIGSSILMFCIGPILLQGKTIIYGLRRALELPLAWSILIGILWRFFSLNLPLPLHTSIQTVGEAAIPLALLLLGIQLAKTRLQFGTRELISVFMRLLLAPLIAYLVGINLHLNNLNLQVLVIQSAMPTAVSSLVLITEFEGDSDFVARTIVMSTLIGFLTIPLIIWLFKFNA